MPQLAAFLCARNWLSGTLDVLSQCTNLKFIKAADNCFEGVIPSSCLSVLSHMIYFRLGSDQDTAAYSDAMRCHHSVAQQKLGYGNSRLRISPEAKAELCFMWEQNKRNYIDNMGEKLKSLLLSCGFKPKEVSPVPQLDKDRKEIW